MPNVYSEGESTRPLPPSYQIIFPGVPGLFANSIYTFSVRIKRERRLLWKRIDVLSTPMKYYPRTRAPRAILKPSLSFFSVLKIAPEEFREVLSIMKTRVGSGFAPIHCLLFIPSSCIYAMTEEIPFHIQLIAPTTSLLAFSYPHVYSGLSRTSVVAQLQTTSQPQSVSRPPIAAVPSGASIRSASTLSRSIRQNITSISTTLSRSRSGVRQLIRVFLLRQIIVEVRGQRAWRTCVLGEGKLTPSPPGHSPPRAYPYPRPEQSHSSFFHPPGTNIASRPSCSPRHSLVMQRTSSICSARGHGAYDFGYKSGACADPDADPIQTLDWDGTVRVENPAEIQAGGFTVGNLVVKDFVVLSLEPPDPARNPLIALQHAHPIRLVTDPLEGDWTR
ncbi:hypothetical protein DFH11DRAFT_216694 [Phellopilus nigrolimitatus]|nr:hypothetical protein DFH11DRAFT_216694 [Phellopilus nigrolimitatus]